VSAGEHPLKSIDAAFVEKAVEKAAHYRLLNWPEEAESICLDVLAVKPDHQKALEILVLALADQFITSGKAPRVQQAKDTAAKLADEYERVYLEGIIHEREGRAHLARGIHGGFAYECFRDAMDSYEKALGLAMAGNQEAALRWNSCARTIERERLEPPPDEPVHGIE
jgi:hypothetical protein